MLICQQILLQCQKLICKEDNESNAVGDGTCLQEALKCCQVAALQPTAVWEDLVARRDQDAACCCDSDTVACCYSNAVASSHSVVLASAVLPLPASHYQMQ